MFSFNAAVAQLNMNLLGHYPIDSLPGSGINDIWGYVDELGNEYALFGLDVGGVAVIDVTDPANPEKIITTTGPSSIWRDVKVWNDHAYITTEAGGGLSIIDLSPLPQSTALFDTTLALWNFGSAHNLYIDENGICYVFGANTGGTRIYDLNQDPLNPVLLGTVQPYYSHDGMARGDTLYLANINDGFLTIYDVSDKANPVLLGTATTPAEFCHNIWISDDGNYAFTTDEISATDLVSWDISDVNDIRLLDRFQSVDGTEGTPHNTFFMDGYLYTSYYRDGVTIHDVHRPDNVVKVGHYDTTPLEGGGFEGCWGVYPYLPSGNIIASDRELGLFILGADLQRACYLEGTVTDFNTGAALNDVQVEILELTDANDITGFSGTYGTGTDSAGFYTAVFFKPNYVPDTVYNVELINGVVKVLDVQLTELEKITLTGHVLDIATNAPIANSEVKLLTPFWEYTTTTDALGNYAIQNFYVGTYKGFAGLWGYNTACYQGLELNSSDTVQNFYLNKGYYDDFTFDLSWETNVPLGDGEFAISNPEGLAFGPVIYSPENDVDYDCDSLAYITGDDVNESVRFTQTLTSPSMDLTTLGDPWINFHYFYYYNNDDSIYAGDDFLEFSLIDGIDTISLQTIALDVPSQGNDEWEFRTIPVTSVVSPSSDMRFMVRAVNFSRQDDNTDFLKVGLDKFWVSAEPVGIEQDSQDLPTVSLYPNPSTDQVTIAWSEGQAEQLMLVDLSGRVVYKAALNNASNQYSFRPQLPAGLYYVQLQLEDGVAITTKMVVQQ